MTFFNQKENILELKLTNYGEDLLSEGKFKPIYYSFSDEGVNYSFVTTASEGQNDIDGRIKLDTPYLRVQKNRFSNSKDGKTTNITGVNIESEIVKRESLGKCDTVSSGSTRLKVVILDNEIEKFSNFYTSSNDYWPDLPIPQIDANLEFQTTIDSAINPTFTFTDEPELTIAYDSIEFPDGGYPYVGTEQFTMLLEEVGVSANFADFEIEVFEISEEGEEPTIDGKAELFIYFFASNVTDYGSGQSDPGFQLVDVFRNKQDFRPDDTSTSITNGTVGINGLTTVAQVAEQFVNAINDPSVSSLGITASVATEFSADGKLIKVKQDTAGVLGNTIITGINDLLDSDQGEIWKSKFRFFTRADVSDLDTSDYIQATIRLADGVDLVYPEEVLRKLTFKKQIEDLYVDDNNLYRSKIDRDNDEALLTKYPVTTDNVEYYFNVYTDDYNEIPKDFICSLVGQLQTKDFALPASLQTLCPESGVQKLSVENVYGDGNPPPDCKD